MFSAFYPCLALNMRRPAHASDPMVLLPSSETIGRIAVTVNLGLGGSGSTVATRPVRPADEPSRSILCASDSRPLLAVDTGRCSQNLHTWRRENVT